MSTPATTTNSALAPGQAVAAVSATGKPAPIATRQAAQDFESFFISQSLESMFAGVDTNSLFGGGQAESTYRSLLVQEYGKIAAKSGGFGIADAVQRQMLQYQEAAGQPALGGSAAAIATGQTASGDDAAGASTTVQGATTDGH